MAHSHGDKRVYSSHKPAHLGDSGGRGKTSKASSHGQLSRPRIMAGNKILSGITRLKILMVSNVTIISRSNWLTEDNHFVISVPEKDSP